MGRTINLTIKHTVGKVGATVGCGDNEDLVGSHPLKYNKIYHSYNYHQKVGWKIGDYAVVLQLEIELLLVLELK